jgi:RNA polymerase-binding transcription factor DksA
VPAADDAERLSLLAAIDADLDGVEQALARLDDGTYATCEVCARALDEEQLAADPVGRRCEDHRTP